MACELEANDTTSTVNMIATNTPQLYHQQNHYQHYHQPLRPSTITITIIIANVTAEKTLTSLTAITSSQRNHHAYHQPHKNDLELAVDFCAEEQLGKVLLVNRRNLHSHLNLQCLF